MSTTLVAYADSDDGKSDAGVEQQPEQQQLTTNKRPKIEVAPEVNTQVRMEEIE